MKICSLSLDLKAVYENGPVTIAINASPRTLTFYSHGVYDDAECVGDPSSLNHQVLVVGYGKLNGKFIQWFFIFLI